MILEENVLNDQIVSYKLGHCDIFSYKSLIKVLFNNPDQFYTFVMFVVPNISILLKNGDFYMFSKMVDFLIGHYTYRIFPPAIDIIPTLLAVVYSNGKYTN